MCHAIAQRPYLKGQGQTCIFIVYMHCFRVRAVISLCIEGF